MKKILGSIVMLAFLSMLFILFRTDYKIAVERPGEAREALETYGSGACPVCGSVKTISEGLYYFKEEAFDSTLTWGVPYKQFQKIYCNNCGVGRLIDYKTIKDIYALNASIVKKNSLNYRYYARDGREIYPYDPDKYITNNDYEEIHYSGDSIPRYKYGRIEFEITRGSSPVNLNELITSKYETENKKHGISWAEFVNDYDYISELYVLWDPKADIQSDKFYKFIGVK